jgi:hypothetical protein
MARFEEISATVEDYVVGMARGDAERLVRAFHPRASEIGHFDGELLWNGMPEFIALCEAEAIAETDPVPAWQIDAISVAGDTAVVQVTNYWAGEKFTDSLTLLRHEGRWQIVAKVFLHVTG